MNSDERILKALKDLQAGQKTLQEDVVSIKNIQQKQGEIQQEQGEHLKSLEAGQKELHAKVDNVELKTEAIHAYQLKAHDEIVGVMHDAIEINGQEQKVLEKRITRIEKHLGLPPMK